LPPMPVIWLPHCCSILQVLGRGSCAFFILDLVLNPCLSSVCASRKANGFPTDRSWSWTVQPPCIPNCCLVVHSSMETVSAHVDRA
jgi:hypothetical protein